MYLLSFEGLWLRILSELVDALEFLCVDLAKVTVANALIGGQETMFSQVRVSEPVTDGALCLLEPASQCLPQLSQVLPSQILQGLTFVLAIRGRGECFDDGFQIGFGEERGVGKVEVVLLNAVVAASCLFMMAVFGYAKFCNFLPVLAPDHFIIIAHPTASINSSELSPINHSRFIK